MSVPNDSRLDAITRDHYVALALAVDSDVWNEQAHWLDPCTLASSRDAGVENPGPAGSVTWKAPWVGSSRHSRLIRRRRLMQMCAEVSRINCSVALSRFGNPEDTAHYSRNARAHQRLAVERAREYIRAKLAEPLRLSDLCRHARTQARSLEYGLREVTGLSPIAYVNSMRLNAVRKILSRRSPPEQSITEIALDQGFWHLSQFAVDTAGSSARRRHRPARKPWRGAPAN